MIKDKHMTATFIDPGAAEFLRPELVKEKTESNMPVKRRKYTVESVEVCLFMLSHCIFICLGFFCLQPTSSSSWFSRTTPLNPWGLTQSRFSGMKLYK